MSEAEETSQRDMETEEPLKGQKVVKGPDWFRDFFVNGNRTKE